jgi:GNAT superfamily N-acetyltransferase
VDKGNIAGMTVRRATPDDIDALIGLVERFYSLDGHKFDAATVRRALAPLLPDDSLGQVWLLEDDARVPSGYTVITWGYSLESGGKDCCVDEIYVGDSGIGHGTTLLTRALAAAAGAGARRVYLETERPNHAARGFYSRLGLVEDDSIWMSAPLVQPDFNSR